MVGWRTCVHHRRLGPLQPVRPARPKRPGLHRGIHIFSCGYSTTHSAVPLDNLLPLNRASTSLSLPGSGVNRPCDSTGRFRAKLCSLLGVAGANSRLPRVQLSSFIPARDAGWGGWFDLLLFALASTLCLQAAFTPTAANPTSKQTTSLLL